MQTFDKLFDDIEHFLWNLNESNHVGVLFF